MPRKFITGEARDVVVKKKREPIEVDCHGGCGRKVTVMSDHVGDVLCAECMKPTSYTLVNDNGDEKSDS